MKRTLLALLLAAAGLSAQAATFNYHGNLQDSGKPANGRYDLELTLYSAAEGGKAIAGPLTMYDVNVHDGSFSAEAAFAGIAAAPNQAWLGVRVREAGKGDFASLGARAPVGTDAIVATNGACPGAWSLDGNAGNPAGSFLGTADANDLVFEAGGNVVGRFAASNGSFAAATTFGAQGNKSAALAQGYVAPAGSYSFSGGLNSVARHDGSFVWGDANSGDGSIGDTASNQFIAQASGGFGINAAPKSGATELSIYPAPSAADNHSHLFFGNTGKAGGVLLSAGDESTATSNDAAFYLDQFDGTNSTRRLVVSPSGKVGINATASDGGTNPLNAELVLGSANAGYLANIKLQGTSSSPTSITLGGQSAVSGSSPAAPSLQVYARLGSGSTVQFDQFQQNQTFLNQAGGTAQALTVGYNSTNGNGAYLTPGGVWTSASSRAFKDGFARIDTVGVLEKLVALPVQTWFYKEGHAEGRHMGPVAEDFAAAFGLGKDTTHIGGVDESGVAFAAIQGLNRKLETENAQLHRQLDALAARLSALEQRKGE